MARRLGDGPIHAFKPSTAGWRCRLFAVFLSLVGLAGLAQQPGPPAVSLNHNNQRAESAARITDWNLTRQQDARRMAAARNIPFFLRDRDGQRLAMLTALRPHGQPLYLATLNVNAAISTATDQVRNTAAYGLDGSSLTLGIWDGGAPRTTHQELTGRVVVMDGADLNNHATHVAGTLAASGVITDAMGMAPAANLHAYDFANDTGEMTARAATSGLPGDQLLLSNHSYGHIAGWYFFGGTWYWFGVWGESEDRFFGQYNTYAALWDDIVWNAPYYLPVVAAGNDRNDGPPAAGAWFYYWNDGWTAKIYDPSTDPKGDGQVNNGYDTISSFANAKNILTVGAVHDAVQDGQRSLSNATMTAFSGWGPSDDGRIKPDVVANGWSLFSCASGGNSSYTTMNGTSMAAPNVAGSAALLQQLWMTTIPGGAMRASTLRGLIIHTADSLSATPGPDYRHGWGLMNTHAAADLVLAAATGHNSYIEELTLNASNPVRLWSVVPQAGTNLRASLAWTDPPGTATDAINNRIPRLAHDLDLRLADPHADPLQPIVHFPYVLNWANPAAPAETGDNIRDNIEQVCIESPPARPHVLRVSHKGTLGDDGQPFSLILCGLESIQPLAPLSAALDQPSQTVATGGHANWTYSLAQSRDGFDAARSGAIGRNQQSWLETQVQGPAHVSFWWRIESRPDHDFGRFYLNDIEQAAISGLEDWHRIEAELTEREPYTLTWAYQKPNAPGAQGSDALWVDALAIQPMQSIIRIEGDLSFGTVTTNRTVSRTVSLNNDGDYPLNIQDIIYPAGFAGAWSGTLEPAETVWVDVAFTPAEAIPYGGNLWVIADADSGNSQHPISGHGSALSIPANWLNAYGLPTDGSADFEDLDGDGFTVWEEWRAGTDPTDSNSCLRIESIHFHPELNGLTITWQSVTGRWYTLTRGTQAFHSTAFTTLTNLPGAAGQTSHEDTPLPGPGPFFYRVRIEAE